MLTLQLVQLLAMHASKINKFFLMLMVFYPNRELISHLNAATAKQMIKDGVITGMDSKIETCLKAFRKWCWLLIF